MMLRMLPFLQKMSTGCYTPHNLLGLSSPSEQVRKQPPLRGDEDLNAGDADSPAEFTAGAGPVF